MASFFDTLAGLGGKYIDSLAVVQPAKPAAVPTVRPTRDEADRAALLAAGNAGPTAAGPGPFGMSSTTSLVVGGVLALAVVIPMVVMLSRIRRG